ncbi:MAG TPA: hypothetical protein VH116_10755, partial [Gemmatimonadales bacterium]|nr:hypothetical protein [Gemmatimonadales bacterium]
AAPFVAALVANPSMEERVRRALSGRAHLYVASTWAELLRVVEWRPVTAILADPLADSARSPEEHIAGLCVESRIPLVLYTALTPRSAASLLSLGRLGIRHLIFYRYDDEPRTLLQALVRPPTDPGGGRFPPDLPLRCA